MTTPAREPDTGALVWPIGSDDAAIFHLLRRALQRHGALWSALVPELTKTQWAVLRAVLSSPLSDQMTIGERTAIDKATLAPLVKRLTERGWLTRETHPGDGRRWRLSLTAEGRELVERVSHVVAEVDKQALNGLGAEDRSVLRRLLTRMA